MLTTEGNPLVKGGPLLKTEENMKIKMLKSIVAGGQPRKSGDIVDVEKGDALELIHWGDAVEAIEDAPKKTGRPKK